MDIKIKLLEEVYTNCALRKEITLDKEKLYFGITSKEKLSKEELNTIPEIDNCDSLIYAYKSKKPRTESYENVILTRGYIIGVCNMHKMKELMKETNATNCDELLYNIIKETTDEIIDFTKRFK